MSAYFPQELSLLSLCHMNSLHHSLSARPLRQAILKNIDLDWSDAQYFLFQIADKLSTPSIRSFETDCLLHWNHYHYVAYYMSLPGMILLLSFLLLDLSCPWYLAKECEFYKKITEIEENITSERRRGNDTSVLQQSLHELKTAPNFFALGRGRDALLSRMDERWEDEYGNAVLGPTEDRVSKMSATAYDMAICFALIMFRFSWIIIIKHLVQLIRTRNFNDTGTYLLADLSLSAETKLHRAWLLGAGVFSVVYLCIPLCLVFWHGVITIVCIGNRWKLGSATYFKVSIPYIIGGILCWWPKVVPYGACPLTQPFDILLDKFVNISIKPLAQIVTIILQDRPLMAAHVSLHRSG